MRRKRIAIIAGGILVLLVALALAAVALIDVNGYRGQVASLLANRLNRQITLGRLSLSLFPLGLRVEDAVIGEAPAFNTGRPFARMRDLYVSPSLMPLLRGSFELRAVELRQPEIELVRNAAGQWNFATLGGSEKETSEKSSLVLNRLVVSGGQVAVTDLQRPRASNASGASSADGRTVYRNIDVQIDDFAPKTAFGIMLAATLPGDGAQRLSIRGRVGPVVPDDVTMTPFEGTAQFDEVSVAGAQRFLDLEALDGTDAVLSGSASVRNHQGLASSNGSLRLEKTRVRGVDIGYPIAVDFDVTHAFQAETLTVKTGKVRLDQTPLSLTGSINLQSETPSLDVHATASDASLAEAARLASAFGVAFGSNTQVQGTANADVRARGPANAPALEGTLRLRNVSISGADFKQPVRTDAIDLTLTPAEIRSNEFAVSTGGTSVGVRAAVTRYATATPAVDAHVRTAGDLGEVLNVARAWGVSAVEGMSGSGRMTLDLGANGPIDRLTYAGSGSLTNATLRTPALTQPLAVRSVSLSFTGDSAVLEKLAATVGKTSMDGRLTVRNFSTPQLDFELSADRLDVKELQALMTPAKPSQSQAQKTAASENNVLLRTTGSGRLRAGSIIYDKLILENVQATATLDRGLIQLNPVTAGLFGGTHRGSITVDARRTPAAFAIASDLEQVDANRLASATTNLRDVIRGALGSSVRMNLAGDGAENMTKSMNGTMSINLSQGTIANMDLRHEIANVARFVTGAPKAERSTSVAALRGNFDVTNGLARTENLTAMIDGGTLGATGTVNLVDQSLNLRLTTVLSNEFSQRVGGSKVGGFMTTALANQQGELVVPLLVTGTMAQPRFAPDVQRVAEMKVRSLLPSLNNPGGLTSGILGAIGGQGEGRPAGKGLGDLLGAVTGRGKPQPTPEQAPQGAGQAAPPRPPPPTETAKPQQPDRGKQVEDALRDLFRRKKPPEEKPAEK